eukprot:m.88862 g.88862  ORF g.88862 m.88862 type:complete len:414 (+) comp26244_c0_seq2:505-1746(+)
MRKLRLVKSIATCVLFGCCVVLISRPSAKQNHAELDAAVHISNTVELLKRDPQLSKSTFLRNKTSKYKSSTPEKTLEPTPKLAYVTLDVTPRSHHMAPKLWVWPGVIAWAQSLREAGLPKHVDIVVMTLSTETLVPGVDEIYLENHIKIVQVPKFSIPASQAQGGAWFLPWHKIGAWSLTHYDTIVYMDADMMALNNTMELFDVLSSSPNLPSTSMYAATTFACDAVKGDPAVAYPSWTSGIMVLQPNLTLFEEMNTFAAAESKWGSQVTAITNNERSDGKFRNDQRFLGEFFTSSLNRAGVYVPQNIYHAHPNLCRRKKDLKKPTRPHWDDTKLTHFGCTTKPWRFEDAGSGCTYTLRQRWRTLFKKSIHTALANQTKQQQHVTMSLVNQTDKALYILVHKNHGIEISDSLD